MSTYEERDGVPGVVAAGGWCAPSETIYDMATGGASLEPGSLVNAEGDLVTSSVPTVREMLAGHKRRAALWAGEAEPTDEEKRIVAGVIYEAYLAEKARWETTERFLARVEAWEAWKPAGIEKQILDLHSRCEQKWGVAGHVDIRCNECEVDEHSVQWPCATARLILQNNYIEVPDELVYEQPLEPMQDADNPRWPFPSGPVDTRFTLPEVSVNRGGIRYGRG